MAGLHVVGEILGATGLFVHENALSLSHVIDLLSLDAASSRSFFCRWRLVLNDDTCGDGDADKSDASAWTNTWELLHGDRHGQTQIHSPSSSLSVSLTCNNETEMKSDVLLDVVWSHPIDLHLTTTAAFTTWPQLELEVWRTLPSHAQVDKLVLTCNE